MRDDFAWLKTNWLECVANDAEVPPNASRFAIMICMHLNRRTRSARVSLDLLAMELRMSKRWLLRVVDVMERRGHIEVSRGGGGRAVNEYRLKLPIDYRPLLERIKEDREKSFSEASRGELAFTSVVPGEVNDCSERGELAFTQTHNITHIPLKSPKNAYDDDVNFAWYAFEAVWQFEMNDRRTAAQKSFEGLTASERRLAIERASAYLRLCTERGSKRRHASRWLRDRGFLDPALSRSSPAAQRLPSEPITTERGVFIRISTDQWRAWSRVDGRLQALDTKFGVGCWRSSEWPPGIDFHAARSVDKVNSQ